MNERIKELAEQCREEYPDTEWPDAVRYRFNEEKFAELIVKECIAVHEDDYGVDIIGDVLKKHFGVEE